MREKEGASMAFIPYLYFRGDCAEAMTFYAEVFGAAAPDLMRYSDAPPEAGLPESERIMHGELRLGDATLMASDFPPGIDEPQAGVSVMHTVDDPDEGARLFAALGQGGSVIEPWQATFFARGYGMLRDRFGTHWIIYAGHP
jgi:PhnB protein